MVLVIFVILEHSASFSPVESQFLNPDWQGRAQPKMPTFTMTVKVWYHEKHDWCCWTRGGSPRLNKIAERDMIYGLFADYFFLSQPWISSTELIPSSPLMGKSRFSLLLLVWLILIHPHITHTPPYLIIRIILSLLFPKSRKSFNSTRYLKNHK